MAEAGEVSRVETMDLSGGDVALDFVNTASARSVGPLQEKLHTYADLVTWAERVGIVDEANGRRLRRAAARDSRADIVLERGRTLREAIYRLFTRSEADPDDLAVLSRESGQGATHRRIEQGPDGYRYAWPETAELDGILGRVAVAAAELLTSPERDRVHECASHDCSWLFLDMSRNRSRRWCDMKVCGNRAKARRFSARHRE
jgi:predicted RNA-binding Zn ribbon-like protein